MLIDRRTLSEHMPWIVLFVGGTLLAAGWFFLEGFWATRWPGGGTFIGLTLGTVGGLLILFEFLLWPRKMFRTFRVGRTKVWMRAHIWLGLLTGPLLLLHSGLRLGGTLSTVLMVLLAVVLLSGIWGLILQNVLPRKMLDEIPSETIYSQIGHVSRQLEEEGDRLVLSTCGPVIKRGAGGALIREHHADDVAVGYLRVGAVRNVGQVIGKVVTTRVPRQQVPDSEPLRVFFDTMLRPYLRDGKKSGSVLRYPNRADAAFRDLRTKLLPAAHPAVEMLESMCTQRRQLDSQAAMHFWLHSWLGIHLPLSVALVVLMFVHIFVALKYW